MIIRLTLKNIITFGKKLKRIFFVVLKNVSVFNMPKKMEAALKKTARKKFHSTTSKKARAYIYGTMRKAGWKPKKK